MINNDKKEYFYCKSFQAFFMALSLIDNGKDVTIITPTKDIIKTCNLMNIEVCTFKHRSAFNIVKHIRKTKKELEQLCSKIKDGVLHFSHTQFNVYCFLLVQLFSRKNRQVVFYNFEYVYNTVKRLIFCKKFIKLLIFKNIINSYFHTNIIIKTISDTLLLGINDEFLKKNHIKIIDNKGEFYEVVLEVSKNNKLKLKPIKNLFLSENLTKNNLIEEVSFKFLNDFLASHDISVKYHPYMNEEDIFFSKEKVPSYLPAELIFNNVTNSVITVYSGALITASKFQNLKAISLLSLVKTTDNSFGIEMKKYLIENSNNRIIFPRTFEELEKYLN